MHRLPSSTKPSRHSHPALHPVTSQVMLSSFMLSQVRGQLEAHSMYSLFSWQMGVRLVGRGLSKVSCEQAHWAAVQ